jgi:hypothetical protein
VLQRQDLVPRGRAFERLSYATPYTVHLSPLPCWEHLAGPEYQRRIAEILDDIESQAALQSASALRRRFGRRWRCQASPRGWLFSDHDPLTISLLCWG